MAYLDHAATTPVLPEVVAAVSAAMTVLGNPSSLHAAGRVTRRRVEEAREEVAAAFGAHPSEVIFTASGTESNNLAISGLFNARSAQDLRRRRILVSAVEHHAVLDVVEQLAAVSGAEIDRLPVDAAGRVTARTFAAAIGRSPETVALATVMWGNNEIGALSPVRELGTMADAAGIPLHVDAAQAAPVLEMAFTDSRITAVSIAGHKLGGPGGTGVLLVRRDAVLRPLIHGGGHERGLRSGTLNTAGVVGLAVAAQHAASNRGIRTGLLDRLRDRLRAGVLAAVPDAIVTGGSVLDADAGRLPGLLHLQFPGAEAETLLMVLDEAGIQVSAGAACTAGVTRASHVLLALGLSEQQARTGLRFSLGHTSSEQDVDDLIAVIGPAVARARAAARRGAGSTTTLVATS